MDKTSASARGSRFRLEPVIVLLLLSTFALSLHVQLAKYDNLSTFPATKHILHGDLRPNGDKPGRSFADVHGATALALIVNLLSDKSTPSRLMSGSVLPTSEPSIREFLDYLALFVRPPPILS
jgi:hypothetical protein